LSGLLAMLSLIGPAAAETYPSHAVRIVVPYPAGSGPDQVARMLAQDLQQSLGQSFIVDDKAGALGTIGTAEVGRSAPDGYTILLTTNTTQAANVALFKKLQYDPEKDFAPITRVVTTSMVLVVRPDFPAQNLKDFIAHARKQSSPLTAAYSTAGSQVSVALLRSLGKFDTVDVPYKGIPPAVMAAVSGEVAFTFSDFAVALAQMQSGTLKGLGVTSLARTPLAPDIPAIAEVMPGFEVTLWYGLVAAAETPRPVVDKLYRAVSRYLATPDATARLAALGMDPAPMAPDKFGGFIKTEIVKWTQQAQAAGIEPQ
jgi:tripartite-type tricarboxylate transporter receptor subunit TctC